MNIRLDEATDMRIFRTEKTLFIKRLETRVPRIFAVSVIGTLRWITLVDPGFGTKVGT